MRISLERPRLDLVAVFVASLIVFPRTASGQTPPGAKYASRNPALCASKKEPTTGGPSGARLVELVKCSNEGVYNGDLYLYENLKVDIGRSRRYLPSDPARDIDPSQPVYPIRGSYDRYQCAEVRDKAHGIKGQFAGENCTVYPQPNAEGLCYQTTFSEWRCSLSDVGAGVTSARHYLPAPR